jgi:hypothetical protein
VEAFLQHRDARALVPRTGAELDYANRHSEPEVMVDAGTVAAMHGHDGIEKVMAQPAAPGAGRRAPGTVAPGMPWRWHASC